MLRLLVLLCLSAGLCFGDTLSGPTELSLKFYDSLSIDGPTKLRYIKAKTLEIHGSLEFNSLAVANKAEVTGDVKGEKGRFGQLYVTGSMKTDRVMCDELVVKGPVTVSYLAVNNQADIEGPLNATHSRFKNLTVQADSITLDGVDVESILVKKGSSNEVLILKGATIVTGDIVFESEKGTVKVENPEVKINGSIKGGSKS